MDRVREVVALTLTERAKAGIKIRQPLRELKIKNQKLKINEELLDLVKKEVNIKDIVFDSKIKEEIELDTKITEDLKEEGNIREIIRQIQSLRKKAGFTPKDKIIIYYRGEKDLKAILEKNKKNILLETRAEEIKEGFQEKEVLAGEKTVKINEKELSLSIKKVK
jgi:isoleucyl-tRNA synthetase